jgi:hypothetical protein
MPSRLSCLSLCAVLAAGFGSFVASRIAPASAQVPASGEPTTLALPPKPSPEARYEAPPVEPPSGLRMPAPVAPATAPKPVEAAPTPLPPTKPAPTEAVAPKRVAPKAGAPAPVPPSPSNRAPVAAAPVATGRASASNPSSGIVAVNRSVPQPLGPNSPPPSSFENSCAPAPYLFQSKAGYEAVRVKDCVNDQLLYLPTSAQTQIGAYVAECQRRCGK